MRMQHTGSIGTNGHMKPERQRDNFRFLSIIVLAITIPGPVRQRNNSQSKACTFHFSWRVLVLSDAQKYNGRTEQEQATKGTCRPLYITTKSRKGLGYSLTGTIILVSIVKNASYYWVALVNNVASSCTIVSQRPTLTKFLCTVLPLHNSCRGFSSN